MHSEEHDRYFGLLAFGLWAIQFRRFVLPPSTNRVTRLGRARIRRAVLGGAASAPARAALPRREHGAGVARRRARGAGRRI